MSSTVPSGPITLTSAYAKLVEKFFAALLARQQYHFQLVEVYQLQIVQVPVSEGESPKLIHSAKDWDDAQTICAGIHVRMCTPPNLVRGGRIYLGSLILRIYLGSLRGSPIDKNYGTRHSTDVLYKSYFFRLMNTMKLKISSSSRCRKKRDRGHDLSD